MWHITSVYTDSFNGMVLTSHSRIETMNTRTIPSKVSSLTAAPLRTLHVIRCMKWLWYPKIISIETQVGITSVQNKWANRDVLTYRRWDQVPRRSKHPLWTGCNHYEPISIAEIISIQFKNDIHPSSTLQIVPVKSLSNLEQQCVGFRPFPFVGFRPFQFHQVCTTDVYPTALVYNDALCVIKYLDWLRVILCKHQSPVEMHHHRFWRNFTQRIHIEYF
jgi:hypothetical protein